MTSFCRCGGMSGKIGQEGPIAKLPPPPEKVMRSSVNVAFPPSVFSASISEILGVTHSNFVWAGAVTKSLLGLEVVAGLSRNHY